MTGTETDLESFLSSLLSFRLSSIFLFLMPGLAGLMGEGRQEDKEESPRGEKRKVKSESMKRKASFEELSKRFKSENDAGVCTIQNSGRESWNDLSAGAEKVH